MRRMRHEQEQRLNGITKETYEAMPPAMQARARSTLPPTSRLPSAL